MDITTFIGIDLAWQSAKNPSGATVLRGDKNGAELVRTAEPLRGNEAVLAFVRNHATDQTVIELTS